VFIDDTIGTVAPITHVNLWTPVQEDKKATLVRIVGDLHVFPDTIIMQEVGAFEFVVNAGIQVVNRALNTAGTARSPSIEDDLEGGEWLWRKSYCFRWVMTAHASVGSLEYKPSSPDLVGSNSSHVDIKVKRKLDLSQDELLLSISGTGASLAVQAIGTLRMLLMAY